MGLPNTDPTLRIDQREYHDAIERAQAQRAEYAALGPAGEFSVTMIQLDIDEALEAQRMGDVVGMRRALGKLTGGA